MKEQFVGSEQGVCSVCGSDNITYGTSLLEDDYIAYEITCDDCKAEGREWYHLDYAETSMTRPKKRK
jgi:hypothetical protein